MAKLTICKGKNDARLSKRVVHGFEVVHKWTRFKEEGCSDNKVYMYCPNCRLVCRRAEGEPYPEDCQKHHIVPMINGSLGTLNEEPDCGCD
jgi:hypothetical protein